MPKGVYDRTPKEKPMTSTETAAPQSSPQPSKLFPVILVKNYAPEGKYEIVGYLKEAVKEKDAAGNWRTISKEEFITGEMKPHLTSGVGFPNKIWAGTHIKLPLDEAKRLVANKLAERADAIAA